MVGADPLHGREDLNQRQETHLGVIEPNRHRAQPPTSPEHGNARQRCNIRIPMLPASGDGHGRAGVAVRTTPTTLRGHKRLLLIRYSEHARRRSCPFYRSRRPDEGLIT